MSHDNRDLAYLAGIIGAAALFGIGALFLASPTTKPPCNLERVAYAPSENLEPIDVALIGRARHSIDFAAYVLTSIPIVEALDAAAARGVRIRIYRDGDDVHAPKALADAYDRLVARPNVEARYKASPAPFMHLKAYSIDGELLREGAGNFTHSGLLRQDNSLVALRCREAAVRFERAFEEMWRR
ncbi:phospholipase D-like domain-containing protein [Methylocystis sp.]|uniref:phospholipase D-like domain-containing protein n=1 Tax=Methylocystis sp. TaxID=1911079 RepID=UPI003D13B2C0